MGNVKQSYWMLYARDPKVGRYGPVNYSTGDVVGNLIRATMFSEIEADKISGDIPKMSEANPGWKFELRKCG